jgi:hypothetical protein
MVEQQVDTTRWSGEGQFTQTILDRLKEIESIARIRVEDAPSTRSEADYNFISNEIYLGFAVRTRTEPATRFGFWPASRSVFEKLMTLPELEAVLTNSESVGPPDYADGGMLQYLKTDRIIPPYQSRGYKLVELIRIYEIGGDVPREQE